MLTVDRSIFPRGQQRDHFLALATPSHVDAMRQRDRGNFFPTHGGCRYATVMSYPFSAAWVWMVWRQATPKMIMYNDI